MIRSIPVRAALAILSAAAVSSCGISSNSAPAQGVAPQVRVLSNRADLVSGGDALVEVVLPAGVSAASVSVNGRDVSPAFAQRANGRFIGLVTGLQDGANEVVARFASGGQRITITNHPIGGPIFSGPQVQPWICNTESNGLAATDDPQCNVEPVYTYSYLPAGTGSGACALTQCVAPFQDYDPENPPSADSIATTTTDQGVTVPFIVRLERGVIDRGIYQIAVLFDPAQPWTPWAPQPGWNHKVLWTFGSGGEPAHAQIGPPEVMDAVALGRGFAVATNAIVHNSQGYNEIVQAESLMMTLEHLIETYGEERYSIGTGCSGGSMSQYSIAANYPGLLDGIQPQCGFPDDHSTYTEMTDCYTLQNYFLTTSPHLWTGAQQAAATGYPTAETCNFMQGRSESYSEPTLGSNCAGFDWTYDPVNNPGGERCTVQDYTVAVYGRRAPDVWTPMEQQIQRGFANRPYDTVGIQYGLKALIAGEILPEQFVDLNEKIGGLDIDRKPQAERTHGDLPAIHAAYRAGKVNAGFQLAKVPFMELRGSSNGEEHYDWHSHLIRNRLIRDNGHAANMVYWLSPGPLVPDPIMTGESFLLVDRWLTAIEADTSSDPLELKVLRHKPLEAVDACWIGGEKITNQMVCDAVIPHFYDPRTVAGAPPTGDTIKCQLKPLNRSDYEFGTVAFTDEQWARLEAAFPEGVCDYALPAIGQVPSEPWMTFADGPPGRPLGAPPQSTGF
jgi:hypothetical protein